MAKTTVSDIIVPQLFAPYAQNITKKLSRLIQTGTLVADNELSAYLGGGGLTFNKPFFKDLDSSDAAQENVSLDGGPDSTPDKIGTFQETQVRLSRNKSWSATDLSQALAGPDPMDAIGSRVGNYWAKRLQSALLATATGVWASNKAATGVAGMVEGDMTYSAIPGTGGYVKDVTDFNLNNFVNAIATMGDASDDVTAVMMHSVVYHSLLKKNQITVIPASQTSPKISFYMGREVIVDDQMPNYMVSTNRVFESWIMARGAFRFGQGSPKTPVEVERNAKANNGGGEEVLFNRVEWILHPLGHSYIGVAPMGGPSNALTANNLGNAASWSRVFPERKQVPMVRLMTVEF